MRRNRCAIKVQHAHQARSIGPAGFSVSASATLQTVAAVGRRGVVRMGVLERLENRCTSQRRRYPPGQAPIVQPETFGSIQAEQPLLKVFRSLEGQGAVMQRIPVSRVAHTGL